MCIFFQNTLLSYISREDQSMMRLFIRYWVVSIEVTASPCSSDSRANSVLPKPFLSASILWIVGASWRWSPAKMHLGPCNKKIRVIFPCWFSNYLTEKLKLHYMTFNIAIQQAISKACAASSMTTTSNPLFRWWKTPDPLKLNDMRSIGINLADNTRIDKCNQRNRVHGTLMWKTPNREKPRDP